MEPHLANARLKRGRVAGPDLLHRHDQILDLLCMRPKLAGKLVVFLPGANINPQRADNSKQDPRYGAFRGRCWDGHYAFKAKRNVKHYIDFGGGVS